MEVLVVGNEFFDALVGPATGAAVASSNTCRPLLRGLLFGELMKESRGLILTASSRAGTGAGRSGPKSKITGVSSKLVKPSVIHMPDND